MPQNSNQLKPNIIPMNSSEGPTFFTMTRFAPVTDDFAFYEEDILVIISPHDALWEAPIVPRSTKSLEEHISYIQENQLKKAFIIAEDISFLRQCPSLERLQIIPPFSASTFDYSPLYDMPNLKQLNCQTVYGPKDNLFADIDYSRISGLEHLNLSGKKGHHNYNSIKGLKTLSFAQGQPVSKTLSDLDVTSLYNLDICQAPIRSLAGLENAKKLRLLGISYCRQLEDISALSSIGDTLTALDIESCGRITDFSVLSELHNLEHLRLYGRNTLPNLDFLRRLPKLKTFTFSVNILDGDLSPCMNIPYASCSNKKHYNLKDSDLPKIINR